jgi:hypothetical protein
MRPEADIWAGLQHVRVVPIVLQNSFWVTEDKFSEPWVWRSNNHLEGLKEKLTGDLGSEPDRTPTSDCCFLGLLAKNESSGI